MATQQNEVVIDNRFFVPPGVVDVRQAGDTDASPHYKLTDIALDNNAPVLSNPNATVPMPPTSFTVVSQQVRISPDGSAVVDVTLDFPDIPGINSIDVRVTKA